MAMKIDLSEDTISMFLGLIIVVLVVFLVSNYIRKNKGNIEVPGVSNNSQEKVGEIKKQENNYVVKKGDSLWKIAENNLGSGFKWIEISRINNLRNPDLIFSGQELKMPVTEVAKSEVTSGEYVVKKGDSLWKISERLYKDGYQWVKLWEANKALIRNPDHIEVGVKLATPQL